MTTARSVPTLTHTPTTVRKTRALAVAGAMLAPTVVGLVAQPTATGRTVPARRASGDAGRHS
jgi:hypothetical protein